MGNSRIEPSSNFTKYTIPVGMSMQKFCVHSAFSLVQFMNTKFGIDIQYRNLILLYRVVVSGGWLGGGSGCTEFCTFSCSPKANFDSSNA